MNVQLPPITVQRWVGSPPLTPDDLNGPLVLLDIWEYTCVKWIRTAPYVKAWHRDYADLNLTVVGVHTPELEFGRHKANIGRAIRDPGLTYPLALDRPAMIRLVADASRVDHLLTLLTSQPRLSAMSPLRPRGRVLI